MSSLHLYKKTWKFSFQLEFLIFYIEFKNDNEKKNYVACVIVASLKKSTNVKWNEKPFPSKFILNSIDVSRNA